MGTGIPSVRGVTRPSNDSVGQRDVVRPRPLHHPSNCPEHHFPFSLYIEQISEASRRWGVALREGGRSTFAKLGGALREGGEAKTLRGFRPPHGNLSQPPWGFRFRARRDGFRPCGKDKKRRDGGCRPVPPPGAVASCRPRYLREK